LSLAATLIAGITATFLYVRRGTSLARLQNEFVQKVSHDLRTPLTSIRMFVETLQDGRLTDRTKIQECLEVLSTETGRLTAMVERLLRWATMEAGRRIYHLQPVAPGAVVRRAVDALAPQLKLLPEAASTDVTVEIADSLPLILADYDALTEAVLNLLQNAIRYTGPTKQIRVRCARQDKEVIITVGDNGPGIAKHEHHRIFKKFYRVVDPANPIVDGTGLGLAIVHHIVRAHQGSIAVESDVGKGAAFHVHLPAAEGAD
jgi:two-component system phosphate regulon sensor histidine kinase PhoR